MERLTHAAATNLEWMALITEKAQAMPGTATCQAWGRKGGSHYKDGQFDKK
jgi:hypothetical protein